MFWHRHYHIERYRRRRLIITCTHHCAYHQFVICPKKQQLRCSLPSYTFVYISPAASSKSEVYPNTIWIGGGRQHLWPRFGFESGGNNPCRIIILPVTCADQRKLEVSFDNFHVSGCILLIVFYYLPSSVQLLKLLSTLLSNSTLLFSTLFTFNFNISLNFSFLPQNGKVSFLRRNNRFVVVAKTQFDRFAASLKCLPP